MIVLKLWFWCKKNKQSKGIYHSLYGSNPKPTFLSSKVWSHSFLDTHITSTYLKHVYFILINPLSALSVIPSPTHIYWKHIDPLGLIVRKIIYSINTWLKSKHHKPWRKLNLHHDYYEVCKHIIRLFNF